jgi:hypothetical protein
MNRALQGSLSAGRKRSARGLLSCPEKSGSYLCRQHHLCTEEIKKKMEKASEVIR